MVSAQTGPSLFLLILKTARTLTKKEIIVNINKIFTDSGLWAGSVIELPGPSVCLSVCLSVYAIVKHPLPAVLETFGQRTYLPNWPEITKFQLFHDV